MKRLNSEGWGLGIFIIYISIFFMAFVLVSYIANKNNLGSNGNIHMTTDQKIVEQYQEYEKEVKSVGMKYQSEKYYDIEEGTRITVNINKIDISEKILHRCTGYIIISKKNGNVTTEPYLKCGSYRTSGYLNGLDK